jgi:nucleoside-diphosphate-sugar epimerase
MKYTVIGGRGFIGSKIVDTLKCENANVWVPEKNNTELFTKELGIVIYCAGHGDCDNGFLKVLDSNVLLLSKVIEKSSFDRLIYVSSTRIYMGQSESNEASDLSILFQDSRRLFNLTKLIAEELLLKSKKDIAIVRPSNVYGLALESPLFLPSIIRNAVNNGKVDMYVSPEYAKDYVSVDDVAVMTIKIAQDVSSKGEIFNIASGDNISAKEIADILKLETNCEIVWHEDGITELFPNTDICKIKEKYTFAPREVLADMTTMIKAYKAFMNKCE